MAEPTPAAEAQSAAPQLDAKIAALEAELRQLKQQRSASQTTPPKPLDGIRVLDLSRFIFGPYCTQNLADLGADIIKVEPRKTGDPSRYIAGGSSQGVSSMFIARNRNKRSLALDMRHAEGQKILLELAEHADVIIHNFRPGIMGKMGLGYDQVSAVNPGIVYCSLSGYGETGPMADWPGQDLLIQGMSGMISVTGWENGPPVAVGMFLADMTGALTATYGVLAALQARERHGVGQEVKVSLLDAMLALQTMEATVALNDNKTPFPSGSGHWLIPQPYGVYQTADKPMILNAHTDGWWGRLVAAPDFAHLNDDPRFETRPSRWDHGPELIEALEAILRTESRDHWLTYLGKYDVLCAPVHTYSEVFADPQVRHNRMVVEQHHPVAGPVQAIAPPVNFSHTPADVGNAAPQLGEHNEEILSGLGYDTARIERLRQDNVL